MKRLFTTLSILAFSFSLLAGGAIKETETYKVNKKLSKLDWVGKKVTGKHEGTIGIKTGEVQIEDGKLIGGSLTVDMNSIAVTDIEDPKDNAKLKGHLSSDDFFGVKKHPTSNFEVTKVEHKEGNDYILYGNLTIKGHTEKVEIPSTMLIKGDKVTIVGEIEIDRTKFGIKYGSGSFFDNLGDRAINDLFTVKFSVAASK